MRRTFAALLVWPLFGLCGPVAADSANDLSTLAAWLSGHFTSAEQAATQEGFVAVELRAAPIWTDRDDGPWLYVEQALAARPEQPYRQRVYRLERTPDGGFASHVYLLPEPTAWIGGWREPARFATLDPARLAAREGCTVWLRRETDGRFRGATVGDGCTSDLGGAAYATSEVELSADRMTSWDRGYDDAGRQVWGSTAGPYVFKRVE